jgi:hypothetical protein
MKYIIIIYYAFRTRAYIRQIIQKKLNTPYVRSESECAIKRTHSHNNAECFAPVITDQTISQNLCHLRHNFTYSHSHILYMLRAHTLIASIYI